VTESELAEMVTKFLIRNGWDCYFEVQLKRKGPRADIVAMRSGVCLVCEVKKAANMRLFNQAINWTGKANFIYVAHPERSFEREGIRKRFNRAEQHLLKYFGIGRLLISPSSNGTSKVTETDAPAYHRIHSKVLVEVLTEEMKKYKPGLANTGYFTPWRRTMDAAVKFIDDNPGCTMRDIIENIEHHYKFYNTARSCVHRWIQKEMVKTKKNGKAWRYYPK